MRSLEEEAGELASHSACRASSYKGAVPSAKVNVCAGDHTARHSPRGPQVTTASDSLKRKAPKSWNLASEGRQLNIGKYILENYRISPGWVTAAHPSYIMCLLNIHSNFRERSIQICKTHIYRVFSPGWLSARLQSEQLCELLLSSLASQGCYTFKVGCRMPFSVRWIFRVL